MHKNVAIRITLILYVLCAMMPLYASDSKNNVGSNGIMQCGRMHDVNMILLQHMFNPDNPLAPPSGNSLTTFGNCDDLDRYVLSSNSDETFVLQAEIEGSKDEPTKYEQLNRLVRAVITRHVFDSKNRCCGKKSNLQIVHEVYGGVWSSTVFTLSLTKSTFNHLKWVYFGQLLQDSSHSPEQYKEIVRRMRVLKCFE